jgi:hypothetical protein
VFKGLINDIKSAAASFLGTYLARASVAVPFIVAVGFATAAIALELTERFGARNALWTLAGGFCAIGLLAALAVTMKEQQQEMEAAEEQERNEGGIGEMTSAAATAAATKAAGHVPAALLGALLQNPSASALPFARMVGRNMPLLLLLALVALLFWPTEHSEASAAQEDDTAAAKPDGQDRSSEERPLQEAA